MLIRFLSLLSLTLTTICIANCHLFHFPLWALSLNYALFLLFLTRKKCCDLTGRPGFIAIFITMFCRYSLVPAVYYFTGQMNLFAPNYNHMDLAVSLMLYEQITMFLFIYLCLKSHKKNVLRTFDYYYSLKGGRLFFFIALLLFLVIAVFYKSLGAGMNVLESGNLNEFSEIESTVSDGEGYINIVWQSLCIWIFVHLVMKQKEYYMLSGKNKHVFLSIIYTYLLILLAFIDQTGLSRWYTIILAGSGLAFLCQLFPQQKAKISRLVIVPALSLMLFATLVKNFAYGGGNSDVETSLVEAALSTIVDTYFAGPANVNSAIGMSLQARMGLGNIVNDLVNNMPVVWQYFDPKETTVFGFNNYVDRISPSGDRGDQIIPLVGQSLIYFGLLLSPLLSVISVKLTDYFDVKFNRDVSYLTFINGMIAVWFGVEAQMLNLTINSSWLYIRILPMFVLLFISSKASFKRRRQFNKLE